MVVLSNISFLFQWEEYKEKSKFQYDLVKLKSQFKTVCMISWCSKYWIDYPGSILIEWNITRICDKIA